MDTLDNPSVSLSADSSLYTREPWGAVVSGGLRMNEREVLELTEEERRILEALRDPEKGEQMYAAAGMARPA